MTFKENIIIGAAGLFALSGSLYLVAFFLGYSPFPEEEEIRAYTLEEFISAGEGEAAPITEAPNPRDVFPLDSIRRKAFLAAIECGGDTALKFVRVSSRENLNVPYEIDLDAGRNVRRIFNGRRINIAIIGVDTRLGGYGKHADANHVLSIMPDSGFIEITSIPRDTYADCGFPDTTNLNKLAVLRAHKGRSEYLKEVARIAGLDRIHYYYEFGFSQAMGIIEILGYSDAGSTLQTLRSRTAFGGDDFQRVYNQAQFIKQAIERNFSRFDKVYGPALIRGGLTLASTNLNQKKAMEIVESLSKSGFPDKKDAMTIRIRPPMKIKYKIYDFSNQVALDDLVEAIESRNGSVDSISVSEKVASLLTELLDKSVADTAKKRYSVVVGRLDRYFDQRAWLQIDDKTQRKNIRDRLAETLSYCFEKIGKKQSADNVRKIVELDDQMFDYPKKTQAVSKKIDKLASPKSDSVIKN